jgi:6-phosphogluconolactonase
MQGAMPVLNRRHFLQSLPAAALVARQAMSQAAMPTLGTQRAFVGSTGKDAQGIFSTYFDPKTGSFSLPEMAAKLPGNDSMALHPHNRRRLYSTCVVDGIANVAGFDMVDGPEILRPINRETAKGTGPNFLSIDPSGRVAMEANWGSGDISTYQLAKDGTLSPYVEHIEYGEANHGPQPAQIHSRCHSILTAPGGRFVLVNDFGADRIYVYALDAATAKLTPNDPPFYQAAPGSAPRHLVFHPNGRLIYCNNELTNTVDLLAWDEKRGVLTRVDSWSTLPTDAPPKCRTADIALSADHRFLYGSVRGLESMVVWAVGRDGRLQQVQFLKVDGVENRCVTLDATGRWLVAANQRSNDVVVFPRDPKTGKLSAPVSSIKLLGACYVLWA